jgi:ABC-type sugar transport system ATPase subunit
MKNAIKISRLSKKFGKKTAVDNVSIDVKEGEIFGFLGPNGAGKTTTIRLILNHISPTAGRIHVFGKDSEKHYVDVHKTIGYLAGDMAMYTGLSGWNYLKYIMRLLDNDPFFGDYEIINAAGKDAGIGKEALEPVLDRIGDPFKTRTITLSCGKLTTGVTVKPWSGVFFLRNTDSPETYFQTAFRAQSPWSITNVDNPNEKEIIKPTCYLLDFAPSRALKLMANYSNELGGVSDNRTTEKRLEEFIEFLPVLCYDGVSMTKLDATAILDISTYGTASTMLAKRWQSARLVDVTTIVLEKVLNAPDVLAALEKIEDFRNLRQDITKTINSEKSLNEKKKDRAETGEEPTKEDKKKEDAEEKENKGFKRQLREKLLKFITRIPVFMYLTDYREETLIDVIRNLEPELFTKVTGLSVRDFDRMCEIGVFNQNELNQAIFMFKRFEDSSLIYAGGRSLSGDEKIGGFDTSLTRDEIDEVILGEVI